MKKSSMLNEMGKEYVNFLRDKGYDTSPHNLGEVQELMQRLLKVTEIQGMQPPTFRVLTPLGARMFFDTNEWEEDIAYDDAGYSLKDYPLDVEDE